MAQRPLAIYQGREIGIETVFTVVGGKQINIQNKVEELRRLGRENKLFCPCGCGSNLVLVAGDKNLREQHFREKHSDYNKGCTYKAEGKTSVCSKIVLKCWLEDKLRINDIESRVPICNIDDTDRKYEYTLLSNCKKIAVNYSRMRENISDEKLELLDQYGHGIKTIHVVDESNGGTNGQYPEWLIKIQKRQGYCLLLSIDGIDYDKANMKAVFYEQNEYGSWNEISIISGKLREYDIVDGGNLIIGGQSLSVMCSLVHSRYVDEVTKRKQKREEELEQRREMEEQRRKEARRQEEERLKREELERENERKKAEAKEKEEKQERLRQKGEERKIEERKQQDEKVAIAIRSGHLPQDERLVDSWGNHWIQCEICGKIDTDKVFPMYGRKNKTNLGTCYECMESKRRIELGTRKENADKTTSSITSGGRKCPKCGADLRERRGPYGRFLGCSNYPKCTFKRSI